MTTWTSMPPLQPMPMRAPGPLTALACGLPRLLSSPPALEIFTACPGWRTGAVQHEFRSQVSMKVNNLSLAPFLLCNVHCHAHWAAHPLELQVQQFCMSTPSLACCSGCVCLHSQNCLNRHTHMPVRLFETLCRRHKDCHFLARCLSYNRLV